MHFDIDQNVNSCLNIIETLFHLLQEIIWDKKLFLALFFLRLSQLSYTEMIIWSANFFVVLTLIYAFEKAQSSGYQVFHKIKTKFKTKNICGGQTELVLFRIYIYFLNSIAYYYFASKKNKNNENWAFIYIRYLANLGCNVSHSVNFMAML